LIEPVGYDFGLSRRGFVQILSAGLMIAAGGPPALAQRNGRRGGFGGSGARTIGARIHIGQDGSITVFTGKVEAGQGARVELSQAAAEELCVPADRLQLIMADTALVPDDGITAAAVVRHGRFLRFAREQQRSDNCSWILPAKNGALSRAPARCVTAKWFTTQLTVRLLIPTWRATRKPSTIRGGNPSGRHDHAGKRVESNGHIGSTR